MSETCFTPDPELRELVSVLGDEYEEIEPIGDGQDSDSDDPCWWVTFIVRPADPDAEERDRPAVPTFVGWFELEQLVYWINERLGVDRAIRLRPCALPPHRNGPLSLRFEIRGYRDDSEAETGIEPDEVAGYIRRIPAMIEEDLERQDEAIERLEVENLERAYGARDCEPPNE